MRSFVKPELVDHPSHYGNGADDPYEVIKVLEAWLTPTEYIGYLKGNQFAYMARHRKKGGLLDLEKANWHGLRLTAYIKKNGFDGFKDELSSADKLMDAAMDHKRHSESVSEPIPLDSTMHRIVVKSVDASSKAVKHRINKRDSRGRKIGKRALRPKG